MTAGLLKAVLDQARRRRLLSDQHICVDGTLVDARASRQLLTQGRLRRAASGPPDFKGETRRSDTHECKTDPGARLYEKAPG